MDNTETTQTGPVITEQTPTSTTTETKFTTVESKPAVVSTYADVMTAIDPFVKRLESIEALFANGNLADRLAALEKAVAPLTAAAAQVVETAGKSLGDRIKRVEQIIVQHFGAHQLSTAEPVTTSTPKPS